MQIEKYKIEEHNQSLLSEHKRKYEFAAADIKNANGIIQKLIDFQCCYSKLGIRYWWYKIRTFSGGREPRNLEEKIEDIGLLHALNRSSGAISLHIPWDIPENYLQLNLLAAQYGIEVSMR